MKRDADRRLAGTGRSDWGYWLMVIGLSIALVAGISAVTVILATEFMF